MKEFDRYEHGCTSSLDRRAKGEMLRDLILMRRRKKGILPVLRNCLFLPLGYNTYSALSSISRCQLRLPFLRLQSPRSVHNHSGQAPYEMVIPNLWQDISAADFRLFQRASKDPKLFSETLSRELSVPIKWSFNEFAENMEAILPLRFPMGLIRICNFIDRAPQPSLVDLSPHAVLEQLPHTQAKTRFQYPVCLRIIRGQVRCRRRGGASLLWLPSEMDLAHTNEHDRKVAGLCLSYLKAIPCQNTKRRKLLSEERYMYAFRFAFESIESGKRLPYVGPIEAEAIRIVARMLGKPRADIANLVRQDPPRVRRLPLVSPLVIERLYGLDQPFPALSDTESCAVRVITLILFHCGRRARCLMNIRLRDFITLGNSCDLRIPDTKVKVGSQPIPLTVLFPSLDLQFLISWLHCLRDNKTSEEAFLFELAGISRGEKMESDVAWSELATRLSRKLRGGNRPVSTHIPRHYFLIWIPIRKLVAHNRWLLHHPLLKDCVNHSWFHSDNLNNLKRLFPSTITDLMSVLPKIVGHSRGTESRRSYLRGCCLEIALLAALLQSLKSLPEATL